MKAIEDWSLPDILHYIQLNELVRLSEPLTDVQQTMDLKLRTEYKKRTGKILKSHLKGGGN